MDGAPRPASGASEGASNPAGAEERLAGAGTAGQPALRMAGIAKSYPMGGKKLEVLTGVDLEVGRGTLLAILGASGSG